jgi:SAM-dependent methyltransferase
LPVPPPNRTWPTEIFEALYAADADPWDFADSWYEHRKYALTVAALPRSRYRRAFEPGCSIGVLTSLLAQRCDSVLAADAVAAAVDQARERLTAHAHVELRQLVIPEQWPHEQFDLIVLSEIATYLDADDLELVAKLSTEALEPGGHLVLVHFLADGGTPSTAREVHRRFQDDPALVSVVEHRDRAFLLEVHARV